MLALGVCEIGRTPVDTRDLGMRPPFILYLNQDVYSQMVTEVRYKAGSVPRVSSRKHQALPSPPV